LRYYYKISIPRIFDIIEKIEELEGKAQCLHKFKNLLLKDKITESRIQPFSLKKVLETYEGQGSNFSKPITVKELKQEVNQLKVEVKELRNHIKTQNLLKEFNPHFSNSRPRKLSLFT